MQRICHNVYVKKHRQKREIPNAEQSLLAQHDYLKKMETERLVDRNSTGIYNSNNNSNNNKHKRRQSKLLIAKKQLKRKNHNLEEEKKQLKKKFNNAK